MDRDKINQNIERVYAFVFNTLGCDLKEATEILTAVLLKRININKKEESKVNG